MFATLIMSLWVSYDNVTQFYTLFPLDISHPLLWKIKVSIKKRRSNFNLSHTDTHNRERVDKELRSRGKEKINK